MREGGKWGGVVYGGNKPVRQCQVAFRGMGFTVRWVNQAVHLHGNKAANRRHKGNAWGQQRVRLERSPGRR